MVGLPDKTPAMQIAGVFVWGKPVGLSHSVASPDWLSSILGKAMRLMMAGLRRLKMLLDQHPWPILLWRWSWLLSGVWYLVNVAATTVMVSLR